MPGLARVGDPDVPHCSGMVRKGHFRDVQANGRGLSCVGHFNTTHKKPCGDKCCGHSMPIFTGNPNVFAHVIPVGRKGDPTCTAVMYGSPNVFANGY